MFSELSIVRRGSRSNIQEPSRFSQNSTLYREGSLSKVPQAPSTWAACARAYWPDYLFLFALLAVLGWAEQAAPFERYIYSKSDNEYWRYSYPLNVKNTVPALTVPVICIFGPWTVFAAYYFIFKPPLLEYHNTILGLLASVLGCAVTTNLIKLGVGRPRPNFFNRCWPDGKVLWGAAGAPLCAGNAINVGEGRKSFPSGHTSWSTSGLGYLSLWLCVKLRCFQGAGHPWTVFAAGSPLAGAVWIGITRLQDYWHHWEDVAAGFALGLLFAWIFHRQQSWLYSDQRSSEDGGPLAASSGELHDLLPRLRLEPCFREQPDVESMGAGIGLQTM